MAKAYIDADSILHVVDDSVHVEKDAVSNIAHTELEHTGGYPVIDGKRYVTYVGKDHATSFVNGNKKDGKQVFTPNEIIKLLERENWY